MWTRMRAVRGLLTSSSRSTTTQGRLIILPSSSSSSTSSSSSNTDDDPPLLLSYSEQRLTALAGCELYPHKFQVTATVQQVRQGYQHLAAGETAAAAGDDGHKYSLAGMVQGVRTAGRHLRFIDLRAGEEEEKFQLIVRSDWLEDGGQNLQLIEQLRRGDRIGREGQDANYLREKSLIPSIADPDPHGSAFKKASRIRLERCGSGSGSRR